MGFGRGMGKKENEEAKERTISFIGAALGLSIKFPCPPLPTQASLLSGPMIGEAISIRSVARGQRGVDPPGAPALIAKWRVAIGLHRPRRLQSWPIATLSALRCHARSSKRRRLSSHFALCPQLPATRLVHCYLHVPT